MAQKNNPTLPQPKGAPAGSYLLGTLLAKASLASAYYTVPTDDQVIHELNTATGLLRVSAVTKGLFVRFAEDDDATGAQAYSTLTVAANPANGDTMTIGDQEYSFWDELVGHAQTVLTLSGAITPGKHASSIITSDTTAPSDGDEVVIGAETYTFKTALSTGPAVPFEVLIGASAAASLDNLKSAINATAGAGTTYGTGTTANATVVATTNTDTAQTVVARVPGTAANSAATTTTSAHLSWEDSTLGGGTGSSVTGVAAETVTLGSKTYSFVDVLSETNGAAAIANQVLFGADSAHALDNLKLAVNHGATEGTNYSTGTVANADCNATTNTDTTQQFEANTAGTAGNSIASTETLANGSFTGATFVEGHADDGQTILIGSAASDTQQNILDAVNGTGTAGTQYSSALVKNADAYVRKWVTNASKVTALVPGAAGDGIATTSDFTDGSNSFSATSTGSGGDTDFDDYIPAGLMHEYAIDDSVSVVAFLGDGGSATAAVVEH